MKILAGAVGGALGIVAGLVVVSVIIVFQGGVCSVPVLNLSHCYGLGPPATLEQLIMLLTGGGVGASAGASWAVSIVGGHSRARRSPSANAGEGPGDGEAD
jgi:hypothetical protein